MVRYAAGVPRLWVAVIVSGHGSGGSGSLGFLIICIFLNPPGGEFHGVRKVITGDDAVVVCIEILHVKHVGVVIQELFHCNL